MNNLELSNMILVNIFEENNIDTVKELEKYMKTITVEKDTKIRYCLELICCEFDIKTVKDLNNYFHTLLKE